MVSTICVTENPLPAFLAALDMGGSSYPQRGRAAWTDYFKRLFALGRESVDFKKGDAGRVASAANNGRIRTGDERGDNGGFAVIGWCQS
jgi:hypothetical protein